MDSIEGTDWYHVSLQGNLVHGACSDIHMPLFKADDIFSAVNNAPAVDAVDADKALEWLEGYTFTDTKQVYTNGTVLVPLFRVRQALKDKAYNGLMEG